MDPGHHLGAIWCLLASGFIFRFPVLGSAPLKYSGTHAA